MTTGADAKAALQQLTERIETRQAELTTLRRKIASTGELVERQERVLYDLERGIFAGRRRGRFLIWLSSALLLIAGFVGYVAYLKFTNQPDTSRLGLEQLTPVRPHLLITSQPPGARIYVDGKSRGTTPKLIVAPRSSGSVEIRVQKRGFAPRSKRLVVKPTSGAHWHVELATPPDSAPTAPGARE